MGSNHKTTFVNERLDFLEKSGLYRRLRTLVANGPTAKVDGKEVINLCSNDYLGLSQNTHVVEKTVRALKQVSQCSSRLIAGNHPRIIQLEELLADHRRKESALVYPTGYAANLGVVMTIAVWRFIMPKTILKIAGGREVHLKNEDKLALKAGANGIITGGYLTTGGNTVNKDIAMIKEIGLKP